jgi:hypothetical protein
VCRLLLKGSKVNFAQKFNELIVVPDGALVFAVRGNSVSEGKTTMPLISKTRVACATMGLAVTDRAGRIESPEIALSWPQARAR